MKNWLKSLTIVSALALVILPCVLFSACSNDNQKSKDHTPTEGDTYVYESVTFEWNVATDEMDDAAKEQFATMKHEMETGMTAAMQGSKIEVISDKQVKMISAEGETTYNYTIADGKVTVVDPTNTQPMTFVIKGETLVGEVAMSTSVKSTVTFKLSK